MGEQAENMRRGEWYLDEPDLQAARRRCDRLLERFHAVQADDDAGRFAVLTELLARIEPGALVVPRFWCSYGAHITLGADCFVNIDAVFMDDAPITVGTHARLGPRVQLLTAQHPLDDHERRRAGWERPRPITIGDNAWLGGGVIVLPGVDVGADAVVGAGSVVTRSIPPRTLAVGNPARVLRTLDRD